VTFPSLPACLGEVGVTVKDGVRSPVFAAEPAAAIISLAYPVQEHRRAPVTGPDLGGDPS
jgi:hypothetical protein